MRWLLVAVGLVLSVNLLACAGAQQAPAAPEPTPVNERVEPAPEARSGLPQAPPGLAAPSATCGAWLEHPSDSCSAAGEDALTALADALAVSTPAERDQALAALERCEPFESGLLRALRAELAPADCRDVLVEPKLGQDERVSFEVEQTLIGLGLAARLTRAVQSPPASEPELTKEQFNEFFKSELAPWITSQAKAVHALALLGSNLTGYGKSIVAIEAGVADLRFVQVVRAAPIPKEMSDDEEVKNTYYAVLDQVLEPRKRRGRDAALVGLKLSAEMGVLHSERVERARKLLSELYGGRRIDALDALLLPEPPSTDETAAPANSARRLAELLPTFYASRLLTDLDPLLSANLRALMSQGVPVAQQNVLQKNALEPTTAELYSHVLLRLGQLYWRSSDFAQAAQVASLHTKDAATQARAELLSALAGALEHGPTDAAEMMLKGPFLPDGVGNVAELDAIGAKKGAFAGQALFNAAYILALVPPVGGSAEGADPASYWKQVAERFSKAQKLLKDPSAKALAADRAEAAQATATAIAEQSSAD